MRKLVIFILALTVSGTVSSPKADSQVTSHKALEPVRIGIFLSLTGATADYGVSALNSFKLATEEVNLNGGIGGRPVQLIIVDDHSNTIEVAPIVERLIQQNRVHALLAEPISTRAMAAAPVAQRSKVVMISPAAVKPELTLQGDYIFRACFTSPVEAEAIAKFAITKLNAKRAAMILDSTNDYASVLGRFFIESFATLGGTVVNQQHYVAGDKDIAAQMSSIEASKPDIIFAPGFYTTAGMVAREFKRQGIKATLIGSDGWDSPSLLKGAGETFAGVYFANHFWIGSDDPLVRKFVRKYQARYKIAPDAGAATAYDAAHLLFAAINRAGSTESLAIRNALAQTSKFQGVTGQITLDANRNADVPVYMLRIERGGKFSLQSQ
ncbi:MAG TPA: ABC transporter substrate-binding protein [Pyrinomonadaceae bacterium]|nr:ABC transporter substrate-binding protein [Pyrinomonadaceae bacterium]